MGMSESSRRIHAASRQATVRLNGFLEEDVRWTEVRVIALMLTGVGFQAAVLQASQECSQRILDRELQALIVLQDYRDRQRDEARAKREAEDAERRSKLEARATLGQRPSLKVSFGDLLAAKGRAR